MRLTTRSAGRRRTSPRPRNTAGRSKFGAADVSPDVARPSSVAFRTWTKARLNSVLAAYMDIAHSPSRTTQIFNILCGSKRPILTGQTKLDVAARLTPTALPGEQQRKKRHKNKEIRIVILTCRPNLNHVTSRISLQNALPQSPHPKLQSRAKAWPAYGSNLRTDAKHQTFAGMDR